MHNDGYLHEINDTLIIVRASSKLLEMGIYIYILGRGGY
jgi:hypothetical protein